MKIPDTGRYWLNIAPFVNIRLSNIIIFLVSDPDVISVKNPN